MLGPLNRGRVQLTRLQFNMELLPSGLWVEGFRAFMGQALGWFLGYSDFVDAARLLE